MYLRKPTVSPPLQKKLTVHMKQSQWTLWARLPEHQFTVLINVWELMAATLSTSCNNSDSYSVSLCMHALLGIEPRTFLLSCVSDAPFFPFIWWQGFAKLPRLSSNSQSSCSASKALALQARATKPGQRAADFKYFPEHWFAHFLWLQNWAISVGIST